MVSQCAGYLAEDDICFAARLDPDSNLWKRSVVENVRAEDMVTISGGRFFCHRGLDSAMDGLDKARQGILHRFAQWWLDRAEGRNADIRMEEMKVE